MSEDKSPEFEEIGERVMVELNRRLATPQLAEDLPGTLLMKVAMDYVKFIEERNRLEEAKMNEVKTDPLEMIDQPGLMLRTRIEILSEWLEEIEGYWTSASNRMAELLAELERENHDSEILQEL